VDSVMAKVPGKLADSGNRMQRELTLDEMHAGHRRMRRRSWSGRLRRRSFKVLGRLSGFGTRFLHDAI